MSSARCAGRSAALVAAGLLLAGPQALGVAAAEERDAAGATDTAKTVAGAEQSSSQREARRLRGEQPQPPAVE